MPDTTTYEAFMLDHAAGNLSPAMAMAGDLHILLSDSGAEACELWQTAAKAMGQISRAICADIDSACDILTSERQNVRWRRGLSGAHYAKVGEAGGKLMRLLPGKSVPTHGHRHLEVTVVLEGALFDGQRVYHEGDIAFGEPGVRHKPSAHGGQPCVCFVAKK